MTTTTLIWVVFGGAILYFFGVVPFRRALDDTRPARQAAKAAMAGLSKEDAKEERMVRREEAKAARMVATARSIERREQKRHARSVRRHFYTAGFWGGRQCAIRDRRFREQYPTAAARRAARRKNWGFPS